MKSKLSLLLILISSVSTAQETLLKYVNPFIGTAKMGHTYPGATVPFGAVQLSPDTDTIPYEMNGKYNGDVYKYCSGYKYEDKTIVGFSHTHFNGTGHSDLGDFLLMPTQGKLQLNPGTAENPSAGYRSTYSHQYEKAEPAYYKVKLDEHDIIAELTASTRVGMHQYTFNKEEESHIILDLMSGIYNYDDKTVWTFVRVVNDTLVTGYRQTNGWARTRTVYFAMTFSKGFKSYGQKNFDGKQVYRGFWGKFNQSKNFPEIAGKKIRMHFDFDTKASEKILVKFAISSVSQQNALENLQTEMPTWNFNKVKADAQKAWNKELQKIKVQGSEEIKVNFYTAMYHAFINPTTYTDVNSEYRGLDQNTHKAIGFTNYTTFSLWDTYRALHPLFNIIQPSRNNDMIHSMMAHYKQSTLKMLPIWSHYSNDNWCMSGYHSVSVIADAIMKGVYTGDENEALNACIETAKHRGYEGIGEYMDRGYISAERSGISVSNTLEYAYDDWCIAQIAKKLDRMDVFTEFSKRAENWKNNYNPKSEFMQPRMADGTFKKEFDALQTHNQGFIGGNSWNYSFFVPHQASELMKIMGGKKKFGQRLDTLFNMHLSDEFFAHTEDISREGIIGGYVHGNEPAHHVAYLYNYAGQAWKTQAQVRRIMSMQYKPTPDGLGGNDDCGQMSAWYIFSALGFYPVAPGNNEYAIGSPMINSAEINLENGKNFKINVINQSEKNVYIDKIELNGKALNTYTLKYEDIMNGGEMKFFMK